MLVRYEKSSFGNILIIDECGKYLGETVIEDFIDSMIDDKDVIIEDEYTYYFVSKEKLNFCFQSFSVEKLKYKI